MPQPNRSPHHRFHWPLIVVLAIGLASAGQALPARAAPAADYSYRVVAALDKGKATICVGDTVTAAVRVLLFKDDTDMGAIRTSLWVEGAVQDPGIGKFVQARKPIGWNSDRPKEVVFAFHANRAGKTTLTFKAEVRYYKSVLYKWLYGPAEYVNSNPVDVTVVNCKYQVKTISNWKVSGLGYMAVMDWTNLTMDADGNFHGTGTAHWSGFWQWFGCNTTLTAPDSPVDLSGVPDQLGHLVITIHFTPVTKPSWRISCPVEGGNTPPQDETVELAPENLTVSLPPVGLGSFTQAQNLPDTINGGIQGGKGGLGHTFVIPVAGK